MEEQKKTTQHRNPIDVIIRAARLYREHLSGNVFLYAFGNQCIEVEFPDWSFKHLAGVNVKAAQHSLIHDGLQEDVKDYIDKYAPFTMRGENDLGQRILDKALQHPAVVKVTNPERDDGRS